MTEIFFSTTLLLLSLLLVY